MKNKIIKKIADFNNNKNTYFTILISSIIISLSSEIISGASFSSLAVWVFIPPYFSDVRFIPICIYYYFGNNSLRLQVGRIPIYHHPILYHYPMRDT